MNTDYYENTDKNFEEALKLNSTEFSNEELKQMLCFGNIVQKQIAALNYSNVKTEEDAKILLDNLTGCDGKIREAVAFQINKILIEKPQTHILFAKLSAETFADATIDINGNICRLVTDSAAILKTYEDFSKQYTQKIIKFAKIALQELDKFIFRDKKYVINKQIFKLYWCLETLKNFYKYAESDDFNYVIEKSFQQKEYTIREKVAEIITDLEGFENIKIQLQNDKNYYVRQAILNH